jgi:hypothetical protein
MDYQEIVQAELLANDVALCTSCDVGRSHTRGFTFADDRIVHYSKKCSTRNTLYGFLHEIGHIVKGHWARLKLRRFIREEQAEEYARESFRMLGLVTPRKRVAMGNAYVARMKSFGDKIIARKKNGARSIK